jgi:hypothetical protein
MDNHPRQRREPSVVVSLLWALLWLALWFWAIIGPLFVLLGALSFFVDLDTLGIQLSLGAGPIQTTGQKNTFIAMGAVMGIVGIGFLWLRKRGYLKYGAEVE